MAINLDTISDTMVPKRKILHLNLSQNRTYSRIRRFPVNKAYLYTMRLLPPAEAFIVITNQTDNGLCRNSTRHIAHTDQPGYGLHLNRKGSFRQTKNLVEVTSQ